MRLQNFALGQVVFPSLLEGLDILADDGLKQASEDGAGRAGI